MKKLFFFILIICFSIESYGQSCNPGGPAGTRDFFTVCEGGTSYSGTNYTLTIGNNKTVILNGDMTLSGTLTIVLVGSTSKLLIQSPNTLTAANIVFSGSATGKVIEIEGPDGTVDVSGDVDFGGLDIELDGEGTLDAGSISGADNVSCTNGENGGTGTCPTINAGDCDPPGSGLCNDSALPIELAYFEAKTSNSQLEISWGTYTEINNDYFSIEKSLDGINYSLLTTVAGAGNSTETLNYSYTEKNPTFGRSYYRLKQTDFDGTSETFAPVAIDFTSLSDGKLSFTNPVTPGEVVSVYTGAEDSENLSIAVYNMFGQEVIFKNFTGSIYEFTLSSEVKPGVYFVKVFSSNTKKTGRLVVQ